MMLFWQEMKRVQNADDLAENCYTNKAGVTCFFSVFLFQIRLKEVSLIDRLTKN
jgi:uncharacterized protein YhbP (UPF0306 family)